LFGFTRTNIARIRWPGRHLDPVSAQPCFGKTKDKTTRSEYLFCKVLDQTFFKKFVGCGATPHDLQPDAQSHIPPPPGGGGV
jgi:hypothetical protein